MKKFYITTAIPYVNANPHIGFTLELVQADVIARYHRQLGDSTYFLTGTDDNALKNVQAAEAAGVDTKEFVDKNADKFIELTKRINISNDYFIRTATDKHFQGAQKLWSACKKEDVYKKKYKGHYCVGCEAFYMEKDLVDGKCPEHKKELEVVEEENYFFKLSNYQKKLEKLIESDTYKVIPESRKNEILSFIRMGLEDFSISRSRDRAKNWGVPVPGDDTQIMYVWFDALSNYITALDYENEGELYKKFWPADTHVIGKGIIRFHAAYWPAMLMSAGIPLPKKLFVHGYINIKGDKMSKSLGNVVNPFELLDKYGVDAVRYYLLKHVHPVQDSDFSYDKFDISYNADLANGLGNLVARVSNLLEKNELEVDIKIDSDKSLIKEFKVKINKYKFNSALELLWGKLRSADETLSAKAPWKMDDKKAIKGVLEPIAQDILNVAELLKPFMPETSEKIIKQFSAKQIKKEEGLFPRIVG